MKPRRGDELLRVLATKTLAGTVRWCPTDDPDVFLAVLSKATIRIERELSPVRYRVTVTDALALPAASWWTDAADAEALWCLAIAQGSYADEVIDLVLGDLRGP